MTLFAVVTIITIPSLTGQGNTVLGECVYRFQKGWMRIKGLGFGFGAGVGSSRGRMDVCACVCCVCECEQKRTGYIGKAGPFFGGGGRGGFPFLSLLFLCTCTLLPVTCMWRVVGVFFSLDKPPFYLHPFFTLFFTRLCTERVVHGGDLHSERR